MSSLEFKYIEHKSLNLLRQDNMLNSISIDGYIKSKINA